jgi:hypothetical protein
MPTRKEREQQVYNIFNALTVDCDGAGCMVSLDGRTSATEALADILFDLDSRLERLERILNIHIGSDD